MGKTINVQCGIYNTEYTLTQHRDGTGTVRAPYIKWTNNTGVLAFANHHVPSKFMHMGAVLGFLSGGSFVLIRETL